MAKFDVYDLDKKKVGEIEARRRHLRGRGERALLLRSGEGEARLRSLGHPRREEPVLVSGGGKKPWKQKHTGRARQGSTRASRWAAARPWALGRATTPTTCRRRSGRRFLALRARAPQPGAEARHRAGGRPSRRPPRRRRCSRSWAPGRRSSSTRPRTPRSRRAWQLLDGSDFLAAEGLNVYDILKHDVFVLTAETAKKLEVSLSRTSIQDAVKRPLITEKAERAPRGEPSVRLRGPLATRRRSR